MEAPNAAPKRFRRFTPAIRPDAALVARQTEATTLAFLAFGGVDAARLFLNSPDDQLGGRPIDVAGESVEGLRRVVDAIAPAVRTSNSLGG